MSFKNPIKVEKLVKLKAQEYLRMMAVILSKKFLNGNSVPFIILLNHQYKGLDEQKSSKLPLFLLGSRDSSWKDYHKKDDGKQKQFTIAGTCRRDGDELVLDIEGSKGLTKVPKKELNYIVKVLKKINPNYTISTTGGSGQVIDEKLNVSQVKEMDQETKDIDEQVTRKIKNTAEVTAYKEGKQKEAKELSKSMKELTNIMATSIKKVSKNVKKGATSKTDIKTMQAANKAYSNTLRLFEAADPRVQKKYQKTIDKMLAKKMDLYALSLSVQKNKTSLAQRLADNYYLKKAKRPSTDKEIETFQGIAKEVLILNKKLGKKASQKLVFEATAYVINKTGPTDFKKKKLKYVKDIIKARA